MVGGAPDPAGDQSAHAQRSTSRSDRSIDSGVWLDESDSGWAGPGDCGGTRTIAGGTPARDDGGSCDCAPESDGVQRRALVIADNQLALNAGWDEEILRLELAALQEEAFDLSLVGFDDEDLARLLAEQDAAEGLTDEDAVPELQENPVSVSGDLWVLGTGG